MRALILVAGCALALSGCTTLRGTTTAQKIDFACELAVLTAQTTDDVAHIAEQRGSDPARASKLATAAAKGEDVTRAICTVATAVAPVL